MAFTLQNDLGNVAGANAYVAAAAFTAYFADRGETFTQTQQAIEAAIVKATSYVDMRFVFFGTKLNGRSQSTLWPRNAIYDEDGHSVTGVPVEIKNAVFEFAKIALTGDLNPDQTPDPSNQIVKEKSITAGPVTTTTKYAVPDYAVAEDFIGYPSIENLFNKFVNSMESSDVSVKFLSRA